MTETKTVNMTPYGENRKK